MKGVVVSPGNAGSLRLGELPMPRRDADLLVQALAIGICGTDLEIVHAGYGVAPSGRRDLVIGHESLGRVLEAPSGSGFSTGDLVVGIVRRPDPEPCACCARGAWDMCRNGRYTERGIKERNGFASEIFTLEPDFAVRVPSSLATTGVLTEPTSIVTKAWRRVRAIAAHNCLDPRCVLVTGAGPIGLLAALLGTQAGLDVHVLDRVEQGPKPQLVRSLGATYHTALDRCPPADVVIECTGAASLVFDVALRTNANAVVCLTGVSEQATEKVDVGALNREIVLENDVVIGSVNANREDYAVAVEHLGSADPEWLDDLITRRVPLDRWSEAFERRPHDVKTVLVFAEH